MDKKIIYVPPRRYDPVTELVKRVSKVERAIPVLKMGDLYRDKTATTIALH